MLKDIKPGQEVIVFGRQLGFVTKRVKDLICEPQVDCQQFRFISKNGINNSITCPPLSLISFKTDPLVVIQARYSAANDWYKTQSEQVAADCYRLELEDCPDNHDNPVLVKSSDNLWLYFGLSF